MAAAAGSCSSRPKSSPRGERRGNVCASAAGARLGVRVTVAARAALPGARERELEREGRWGLNGSVLRPWEPRFGVGHDDVTTAEQPGLPHLHKARRLAPETGRGRHAKTLPLQTGQAPDSLVFFPTRYRPHSTVLRCKYCANTMRFRVGGPGAPGSRSVIRRVDHQDFPSASTSLQKKEMVSPVSGPRRLEGQVNRL